MKILYTSPQSGRSIAILDSNNYAHCKVAEREDKKGDAVNYPEDPKYFSTLETAVSSLARAEADEIAEDLNGWVEEIKSATNRMGNLLKADS